MRSTLTAALVATAALFAPLQALAEEVSLRLAHVFPAQSSVGEAADMFARLADERSEGRIKVTVFPAGQLGGDEAIGRELSRGTIQLALVNPNSLVGIDPLFDFHILPYIVSNYEEADRIFYGEPNILHETLNDALERHRMKRLGYFENDFRAISNSRHAVATVADLAGLKLRVVPSQSLKLFFEKAGSQAIVLPFPEVFTALQQGTVDGQENPLSVIMAAKFDQVQKHLSLTGHVYAPAVVMVSPTVYAGLSDADKQAFVEAAKKGAQAMRAFVDNIEKTGVEQLKSEGMEVVVTVDRKSFEDAVAPAYEEYYKRFDKKLIEDIRNTR